MKRRDDPNQTLIDWGNPQAPAIAAASTLPDPVKLIAGAPAPLVQRLPWDFATTFPQPTDEAIEAGVVDETDTQPENLKSLHDNYSRQCLATLAQIDKVMDARRRKVNPATGKVPKTHAAKERLRKYLDEEPGRLEHAYGVLIETYENAFGPDAAQAFSKCVRARHAGIPVEVEGRQQPEPDGRTNRIVQKRRTPAVLPVPKPLDEAIAAKHFGVDDKGKPIIPSAAEVRGITENHAEHIIELFEATRELERSLASTQCSDRARVGAERNRLKARVESAIEKYPTSFGEEAASRLEAYARRQALLGGRGDRGR